MAPRRPRPTADRPDAAAIDRMRPTHSKVWRTQVEPHRVIHPKAEAYYSEPGEPYGAFRFPGPVADKGSSFLAIVSDGLDWDHVSVSLPGLNRCPTWEEMHYIKKLFFEDSEVVMQLHPAETSYVNMHPFCLHLWRPHKLTVPLPPVGMV